MLGPTIYLLFLLLLPLSSPFSSPSRPAPTNKAERRAETLFFINSASPMQPPIPPSSPYSLTTSILKTLTCSMISRNAADPTILFSPTSPTAPYSIVAHVTSEPQLRAVIAGLKLDVKEWSNTYSDGPTPMNKQLPQVLFGIDANHHTMTQNEKDEWKSLATLYPDGVTPIGTTGAGLQPRNSRSVYSSGWVVLDFGFAACHVMTELSRELYALEDKIVKEGGEVVAIDTGMRTKEEGGYSTSVVEVAPDPFWS